MYADRVQEVLDYLTDHPISVQSERMFYQPTSELDSSRLPDVIEGLKAEDVMLEQAKIQGRINAKPVDKMQEHSADVTVAMLYFVCQGMDEAHKIKALYNVFNTLNNKLDHIYYKKVPLSCDLTTF